MSCGLASQAGLAISGGVLLAAWLTYSQIQSYKRRQMYLAMKAKKF